MAIVTVRVDGPVAITGAGSGGTSMIDDAAFTPGASGITPAGGTYRSVRDAIDDGDGGAIAITPKRAIYTTLETPNADSAMDDVNDAVRVNVVAGAAGGGAATIADGADVAEGTTTDAGIITNVAGTVVGFLRGAIIQWAKLVAQILDYDTGAGTTNQVIFGIALPASGGPVAGGTNTNPVVTIQTGANATLSNVTSDASAGGVTLLASNAARRKAILVNDADKICYMKYGSTPTTTSFTKMLLPGETWTVDLYTGIITGIWESGPTGASRATEIVA